MIEKEDLKRITENLDLVHDFGENIGKNVHNAISFIFKNIWKVVILGSFGIVFILYGFAVGIGKKRKK